LTEQVQDVARKKEKAKETLEETSDKTSEQRNRFIEQVRDLQTEIRTKDATIKHLAERLATALEQ
jgi:Ran GTPase-activating protein (RanGAP) involved in mRNA processing and transport